MKKLNRKLIAGTAMVATAAALTACGIQTVYGPPPVEEPEITIEDIDIGPEEDVYGPPEYFGETEADDSLLNRSRRFTDLLLEINPRFSRNMFL